ncbi:MAG: hypothetical protein HGA36_03985 [Candidatus Moranbacteria bacterium]|nr:hypothetical protein [Candidatus Moranbacteria bacterium]
MKRYQKTTMEWNCYLGLKTIVPVTDWHEQSEKHIHTVSSIKATALPDRRGQVEVCIRRVCISPTTERKNILTLLSEGLWKQKKELLRLNNNNDHIIIKNENDHSGVYAIEFQMDNGENFCDMAINIVQEILNILGVDDNNGHTVANFTIKQETYVQFEDNWITFASWLRIRHRLPMCY